MGSLPCYRYCEKNRNQQQILMIQQTTTRTTAQMSNFKTKQKIQQQKQLVKLSSGLEQEKIVEGLIPTFSYCSPMDKHIEQTTEKKPAQIRFNSERPHTVLEMVFNSRVRERSL